MVIDNLSNSFRAVFERIEMMVAQYYATEGKGHRPPSLQFHEADFRDVENMANILETYAVPLECKLGPFSSDQRRRSNITGVIHFAAYKSIEESIKQPLKYYANNVGGLIDFCAILSKFGIKKLVFSSSATVYGTVADTGVPLREEYCSQESIVYIDDDGMKKRAEPGSSGLTNP